MYKADLLALCEKMQASAAEQLHFVAVVRGLMEKRGDNEPITMRDVVPRQRMKKKNEFRIDESDVDRAKGWLWRIGFDDFVTVEELAFNVGITRQAAGKILRHLRWTHSRALVPKLDIDGKEIGSERRWVYRRPVDEIVREENRLADEAASAAADVPVPLAYKPPEPKAVKPLVVDKPAPAPHPGDWRWTLEPWQYIGPGGGPDGLGDGAVFHARDGYAPHPEIEAWFAACARWAAENPGAPLPEYQSPTPAEARAAWAARGDADEMPPGIAETELAEQALTALEAEDDEPDATVDEIGQWLKGVKG